MSTEECEDPRSPDDENNEDNLDGWKSSNSNLSYISASHSFDDTFLTKLSDDGLEEVTMLLARLLSKYRNISSPTRITSAKGLILLLEESLEEFKQQEESLKQICEQKDSEISDIKTSHEEKVIKLLDSHKYRIANIVTSNEKQLSATLERAVNSRRQSEVLQIQLNDARSRLSLVEKKYGEEYLNAVSGNQLNVQQREEEINKIAALEDEIIRFKNIEAQLIVERKNLAQEINEQKEANDAFNVSAARLASKEEELVKERELNQKLWSANNALSQDIAVLQSKLNTAHQELAHRNKMFSVFKEEMVNLAEKENEKSSLSEEIKSKENDVVKLKKVLFEKNQLNQNCKAQLIEVERQLKTKSVQIQMNCDRVASFDQRLKHLEEQILNTSTAVVMKENDLKELHLKLKTREDMLHRLACKAQEEKVKASELDTTFKLSVERERSLSAKLRLIRKDEAQLENDITLHQSRKESLLQVLQSRKNIIHQLESEEERTDARFTELFNKNLPGVNETYDVNGSLASKESSLTGEGNSYTRDSFETTINHWQRNLNHSATNYDLLDMSITSSLTDNIIVNETLPDTVDMVCCPLTPKKFEVFSDMNKNIKSEMISLSPSDTDSGISFINEGAKMAAATNLQSTPVKIEPKNSQNEDLSPIQSISDKGQPNTSRPPAVSINIYQATGRVRHNSLPSSAGKKPLRYKTKLQNCLPSYPSSSTALPTQEQSSQTSTSSFLESYRSRQNIERLPADGVEPLLRK